MAEARVAVTGVGVVSPLGLHAHQHFDAWLAGGSAVKVADDPLFPAQGPQLEARVSGFDRRAAVTNRMLRKLLSPTAGYAVAAAGDAIGDAGLDHDKAVLEGCGLYVGSLSLEIDPEVFLPPLRASLTREGRFDISLFARRGMNLLDPLFLLRALPNAGVCGISVEHQVLGPNTNLTNGTTSGLLSVGLAMAAIQRGEVQCAVAGGYDTLLMMDSIAEHLIANRLSRRSDDPAGACRPFDRRRDGYVLGEGAAFVFLESSEHARQRDARVYAELRSFAQTTDARLLQAEHATDATALQRAGAAALEGDGGGARELGAVFGDGLGTWEDDLREAGALGQLLSGAEVPFTAATSAIGFTGAASGVFSLVHGALAMSREVAPPLVNCDDPDPDCRVWSHARSQPLASPRALVWNSDRGAKNVALLLQAAPG
jgi:3-oxoacyl-[acyl-carrier-protein] synthase II